MIKTIEDLDESRRGIIAERQDRPESWWKGAAKSVREHDAAHGLPADLVVSLMRLHAADPASVTAVARVVAERLRQIEGEGWTPEHDDRHSHGEMALAAACYAWCSGTVGRVFEHGRWPWDLKWWKPSTPERDRCKATALLVAEDAKAIRADEPCSTCGGKGEVGGLLPNGGGYQTDPCPTCGGLGRGRKANANL